MGRGNYIPLPSYLTIKESSIHGLGVFATENIKKKMKIGISHVFNKSFSDGVIRTPLGGFINHANNPNCYKILIDINSTTKGYYINSNQQINKGEELTVYYTIGKQYIINKILGGPTLPDPI